MCVWYKVKVSFHSFIFFPLGDRLAILFKLDVFGGQICFMKGQLNYFLFEFEKFVCIELIRRKVNYSVRTLRTFRRGVICCHAD